MYYWLAFLTFESVFTFNLTLSRKRVAHVHLCIPHVVNSFKRKEKRMSTLKVSPVCVGFTVTHNYFTSVWRFYCYYMPYLPVRVGFTVATCYIFTSARRFYCYNKSWTITSIWITRMNFHDRF